MAIWVLERLGVASEIIVLRSNLCHGDVPTAELPGTRGGRVVIPDGRFLTAAIRLESGVNLHLAPKATLAFSSDSRE